jgi:hypothetical protein
VVRVLENLKGKTSKKKKHGLGRREEIRTRSEAKKGRKIRDEGG